MFKLSKVSLCLSIATMLFSFSAAADNDLRVDVGAGLVEVGGGGYDTGLVLDQSVALENVLVYRLGYVLMNDIHLKDSPRDNDAVEIEVTAPYVGVGKTIPLKRLKLEAGAGLMFAKTEGEYLGRRFSDDREARPYANAKLLVPLSDLISLHADIKYINDVSGADLYLFTGGVRFSF